MQVITEGTTLFHHRVFNQANNEPLHPNPHPLWPAQRTGWHVACEENWITKVLPTTEHTKLHVGQLVIWKTLLELQSERGVFLRSSEL